MAAGIEDGMLLPGGREFQHCNLLAATSSSPSAIKTTICLNKVIVDSRLCPQRATHDEQQVLAGLYHLAKFGWNLGCHVCCILNAI